MAKTQPSIAGSVVAFPQPGKGRAIGGQLRLTPLDRMEVFAWHDRARLAGYDRMVIHDRDTGDAAEVGNFLSVYRQGDPWSRWCFARAGSMIRAWCSVSAEDMGEYGSLGEALAAVLRAAPVQAGRPPTAQIIHFTPAQRRSASNLGSAA